MKIIFGIPPKDHQKITLDEVNGMSDLGYTCYTTAFGMNNSSAGTISKLFNTLRNAFSIIYKLYSVNPNILYLSSRVEPIAFIRDFITILLVRIFYQKKVRIVIKSHGSDYTHFSNKGFFYDKLINPFLRKQVDGWLMLSNDECISMHDALFDKSKVFLTTNIVSDIEMEQSDEAKNYFDKIPVGKFKVFFCGRIISEKGCYDIIDSVEKIVQKDKMIFVFLGDGPELLKIKKIVSERKLERFFLFLGWVREPVSNYLISKADTLLLPSYSEGFSMVLFRSIANGIPVITTRIRAAKDYLKAPDNVLWVNIGQPKEIAEAVNRLYSDTDLRKKMQENNALLGAKFSRKSTCENLSIIFKTICT